MEKNYSKSNQIFSICCSLTLDNFHVSLGELSVTLSGASSQVRVRPARLLVAAGSTLLGEGACLPGVMAPPLTARAELSIEIFITAYGFWRMNECCVASVNEHRILKIFI